MSREERTSVLLLGSIYLQAMSVKDVCSCSFTSSHVAYTEPVGTTEPQVALMWVARHIGPNIPYLWHLQRSHNLTVV